MQFIDVQTEALHEYSDARTRKKNLTKLDILDWSYHASWHYVNCVRPVF